MADLPAIGFIGLGTMGLPMAALVQGAGYGLNIVDFDPPLPQLPGGSLPVFFSY